MADAYLKPQSPILYKNNYIYPLTTHDQVILADGSRWDGTVISGSRTINGHSLSEDVVLTAEDLGNAVLKTGDTMTGALTVNGIQLQGASYMRLIFNDKQGNYMAAVRSGDLSTKTQLCFELFHRDQNGNETRYAERYWLPEPDANRTVAKDYYILTNKSPVSIAWGGTGASTAEQALANLGAFSNKGGTITGDVTATGTITATKVIGAVYA